jgi:2-polyprenyl-3-methyl-5-hydroxy-6-metoxy-1,4-benzoquinol methylase
MKDDPTGDEEARAFDCQILDRIAHGHIPDLRRAAPCHYFYNNSWREPEYVALDFQDQFELFKTNLVNYIGPPRRSAAVLEVGCGPGYLSLEIARLGYSVTGVDCSQVCINVAERFAESDPWKAQRGPLVYHCRDILTDTSLTPGSFDAVVTLGALHHFKDQGYICGKIRSLLRPGGFVLIHEPTRDRLNFGAVALVHCIRTLLSVGGGYYEKIPIPIDKDELDKTIRNVFSELSYKNNIGQNTQSIHDNDAGYKEMIGALDETFERIECRDRYAIFHEIIGGLRFEHSKNVELAKYIRNLDSLLCEQGVLTATEFFYIGKA